MLRLAEEEVTVTGAPAEARRRLPHPAGPDVEQVLVEIDGAPLFLAGVQVVEARPSGGGVKDGRLPGLALPAGPDHGHGNFLPEEVFGLVSDPEVGVGRK